MGSVAAVLSYHQAPPEGFMCAARIGVAEEISWHVKRNEIGPVYWTTCRVTHCERGHEFGFEVLVGSAAVNNWHYRFVAQDDGTVVTESFRTPEPLVLRPLTFLGEPRRRRNIRDMTRTLEHIKAEVENR